MILDALLQLSDGQVVTADAVSTNSVDLGAMTPKRVPGVGEPMCVVVNIKAAGTNSGSLKITVVLSAAGALTAPIIVGEVDLAAADLVLGATVVVGISSGVPALRYLGVNYDVTGTVDVTVDAFYQPRSMASVHRNTAYAKNYAV